VEIFPYIKYGIKQQSQYKFIYLMQIHHQQQHPILYLFMHSTPKRSQ